MDTFVIFTTWLYFGCVQRRLRAKIDPFYYFKKYLP